MSYRSSTTALLIALALATTARAQDHNAYLREVADQFHRTANVYTDADAAGNAFTMPGKMFSVGNATAVLPLLQSHPASDCDAGVSGGPSGIHCIKAQYLVSRFPAWGGWYFLNGKLSDTMRQPDANWGETPQSGVDLSGATVLRFRARGHTGGEVVNFIAFGVGWNPDNGAMIAPYPDSSPRVRRVITLSKNWQEYTLDLTGRNISYVLGGFGWIVDSDENQARANQVLTFYIDDVRYDKSRLEQPRFLVSYRATSPTHAFDRVNRNAGYTYDNALAMMAFLHAGDTARARLVADAIRYAVDHDRYYADGRIRNAYQAGSLWLPPGWTPNGKAGTVRMPGWFDPAVEQWFEDQTHVSTSTGNVAWAALAMLAFFGRAGGAEYLNTAVRLAEWADATVKDTRIDGGYTGGFDGWELPAGPVKRLFASTEHNLDLYAVFRRLHALTGNGKWLIAADHAKRFVERMWDEVDGKFYTGTDELGNLNLDPLPLDVQVWALQALRDDSARYRRAIAYIEAHHSVDGGFGFRQRGCPGGDGVWFEGTAQAALAYRLLGEQAKHQAALARIHASQDPSGGVPAASIDGLCTGFNLNDGQPWLYFNRLHVGATAWFALAGGGVNPFWYGDASMPAAPAPSSPANGSVNVPTSPMLTWNAVPSASRYEVHLRAGAGPETVYAGITGTSLTPGGLGLGTTYSWYVVAVNMSGVAASPVRTFTTAAADPDPLRFVPLTPCRLADTRLAGGPLAAHSTRTFPVAGFCDVPADGKAYSLNVTIVPTGALGYLTLWPAGAPQPFVSTMNSPDGRIKANAAVVPAGSGGTVSIYVTDESHVILDVNGYFTASASPDALAFYAESPCRVVETQASAGPFGGPHMSVGETRSFPLGTSACAFPAGVRAYSLNVTVAPMTPLSYLTAWPSTLPRPLVSTLNAPNGIPTANAAIVPAGPDRGVQFYVTESTRLVVDRNGYFAAAGGPQQQFFRPLAPCRVLDTREPGQGPILDGERQAAFAGRCGIPSTAAAVVLNATVVPDGPLGYLTLWPTGGARPVVSTLNASDGVVTSNMAIVPLQGGSVSMFSAGRTHVIFDVSGYFAP